jgi:hypothetical protein
VPASVDVWLENQVIFVWEHLEDSTQESSILFSILFKEDHMSGH